METGCIHPTRTVIAVMASTVLHSNGSIKAYPAPIVNVTRAPPSFRVRSSVSVVLIFTPDLTPSELRKGASAQAGEPGAETLPRICPRGIVAASGFGWSPTGWLMSQL